MSNSNSLKRKFFFEDETTTNKHIKMENVQTLDNETLLSNEYNEEDSVILELDNNICSPLLKNMFQPIISKYVEYYDNTNFRNIIIKHPVTSIELFGRPVVEFAVSQLRNSQYQELLLNLFGGKYYSCYSALSKLEGKSEQDNVIKYLPKNLPNYPQSLVQALQSCPYVIKYIVEEDFKHLNKELVKGCAKTIHQLLRILPNNYKSDRDIVLEAVKLDGLSLYFASDVLKSDEEIVLAAVKENGKSLDYASDKFKRQKSLKLLAIESNIYHYEPDFIVQETDKEILLPAVKKFPTLLQKLTHCISDREIVFEAVKRNGQMFKYASTELQSTRELVENAIESGTFFFNDFPLKFKLDKEIILKAIEKDIKIFSSIAKEMQMDKDIAVKALQYKVHYSKLPKEALNDKVVIFEILTQETRDRKIKDIPSSLLRYLLDNIEQEDWIDWLIEFLK